jgi:hypothetical protein
MKILTDHCIVKVRDIVLDKAPAMTPNGFVWVNPSFDPQRHTMTHGIVESVPNGLGRFPLVGKHISYPAYHEGNPMFPWKTTEDIPLEVRVGDKIWFHYAQLLPDDHKDLYNHQYIKSKLEIENGEEVVYHYFKILYQMIFAAVRYQPVGGWCDPFQWWMEKELQEFSTEIHDEDSEERSVLQKVTRYRKGESVYVKEVQMIGSWVLIDVDMETWEDISLPTPQTLNGQVILDHKGKPKLKPKEEWVVTKSAPSNRYLCGWVRFIGSPLNGDPCHLSPGDYVYFRPAADTLMNFEGKEYYRMIQRNIFGMIPYVSTAVA